MTGRAGRRAFFEESMKSISVNSYAKINLSLDVQGLTKDGYHQVSMIMQQISLHDDVLVCFLPFRERKDAVYILKNRPKKERLCESSVQKEENDGDSEMEIMLSSNRPYLPKDRRNLAYRAAELMISRYGRNTALCGGLLRIDIKKRIPVAAGLAGGSGNAAAVIHALNKIFELRLSMQELMKIGGELGSDVPFCLMGQARCNPVLDQYLRKNRMAASAAVAEGRGTVLRPVKGLRSSIVLVKPAFSVSTREVYAGIDREIEFIERRHEILRPDNKELIEGLREKDYQKITRNMVNVLELYTLKAYPYVGKIKEAMAEKTAADAVLMSGSGPTVYGIYHDKAEARSAYRLMRKQEKETYLTNTTY